MNVSILIPSRNGVELLDWAYNSIRKNQGNHDVEIIVLDDNSDKDDTWEWCERTMLADPKFRAFRNKGARLGISGGYKFLAQQATKNVICHWHNDMFMTEGTLDKVQDQLNYYGRDECDNQLMWPLTDLAICLTRIEPPIYPPGPEKITWKNGPVDFDDWDEQKFLDYLPFAEKEWAGKTTGGHFAPFFMLKSGYNRLGGNDIKHFPLQSREDSDWAFRLVLAGYNTIQIPHFVFHFASRGNRRSKHETTAAVDNPAWVEHNAKATRNFIRKWRTFDLHDELLKPIPPKVYDVVCVVKNCTYNLMANLEPWFRMIEVDLPGGMVYDYIHKEKSTYSIGERVCFSGFVERYETPDMILSIDGNRFTGDDFFYVQKLSSIISESDMEVGGEYEIGTMRIKVNKIKEYQDTLIICNNDLLSLPE